MKKLQSKFFPFIFLIIVTLVPLIGLLHPGLPVTDDGQDHVARIANFYQSLTEGNLVPRWAANLNWGYGHPILMFLYPLPSYVASLFHVIGFSFVDSTKLVFGFSFIASVLTMYLWMRTAFGKKAGLIGALLYVFAPYRFVDLYARGALGEHVAFIFPPLVLYFLFQIAHCQKFDRHSIRNIVGASLSLAALILSHNAIAIMFCPIILAYMVYLWFYEVKQKKFFSAGCFLTIFFGFLLSAFFWVPAYFEGKYTLRDIVTAGEALQRFVPWSWFVFSPWTEGAGLELTKELGFIQWFGVVGSLWVIAKTKDRNVRVICISLLVILFGSLFIMTSTSAVIWQKMTLLQDFQFPWRFLSVSVFAAAALGGLVLAKISKTPKWDLIIIILVCVVSVLLTVTMWHPRAYQIKDSSFYTGIYNGTTDTGESSPIWSVRFMEHSAPGPMEVIDGNAVIIPGKRTTTSHDYTVNAKIRTRLLENTLYFPGWNIYIDGNPTVVEFQDPRYRGLMTFYVTPGVHTIHVVFTDTKLRASANWTSLISLLVFIGIGIKGELWRRKK